MVATEFVPKSHEKVALENLTLVLMQSARKRTGLVLISANYVAKYDADQSIRCYRATGVTRTFQLQPWRARTRRS